MILHTHCQQFTSARLANSSNVPITQSSYKRIICATQSVQSTVAERWGGGPGAGVFPFRFGGSSAAQAYSLHTSHRS